MLRAVSLSRLGETRSPSIVALAEAGAVTTEIAQVIAADVDLEAGTVALGPSLHARARVVPLTDWGQAQLGRRIRHLDSTDMPLCYGGAGRRNAGQASMSTMLRRLFTSAGLTAEPDLGLGSVRAWAGRQAFDATGRIEDAAMLPRLSQPRHRRTAHRPRLGLRPMTEPRRVTSRLPMRAQVQALLDDDFVWDAAERLEALADAGRRPNPGWAPTGLSAGVRTDLGRARAACSARSRQVEVELACRRLGLVGPDPLPRQHTGVSSCPPRRCDATTTPTCATATSPTDDQLAEISPRSSPPTPPSSPSIIGLCDPDGGGSLTHPHPDRVVAG